MSVLKKLMDARIQLQSRKLKKSGINKFAKYEYFELHDFLPTVQIIFNDIGLAGYVTFGAERATLKIVDIDDGQSIEIETPMAKAELKGCHDVQNLGAVQTYLRRYLWVAAMEIVEHDALDSGLVEKGSEQSNKLPDDQYAKYVESITGANTAADVKKIWDEAFAKCKEIGDADTVKSIKDTVTKRLEKIKNMEDVPQ